MAELKQHVTAISVENTLFVKKDASRWDMQ